MQIEDYKHFKLMKNEESLRWGNAGKDTANGDNSITTYFLGDLHLKSIWNIRMVLMTFLVSKKCQCVHTHKADEKPKRAQELKYIPLKTGTRKEW